MPSLVLSIEKIVPQAEENRQEWKELQERFRNIKNNLDRIDSNLVFSFMEGNLIRAIKNGDWVLIDEINLATNDVLQKIVPLIEGKSLLLYEKGDLVHVQRHKDFRILACMNPANDSGKKALPSSLMNKFTVLHLQEPSILDVELMVKEITPQLSPSTIADIYFKVKRHQTISLRNLSRCLTYVNRNCSEYSWKRALYDGLILGFQNKTILSEFEDHTLPKAKPHQMELSGFLVEKGTHAHQG